MAIAVYYNKRLSVRLYPETLNIYHPYKNACECCFPQNIWFQFTLLKLNVLPMLLHVVFKNNIVIKERKIGEEG